MKLWNTGQAYGKDVIYRCSFANFDALKHSAFWQRAYVSPSSPVIASRSCCTVSDQSVEAPRPTVWSQWCLFPKSAWTALARNARKLGILENIIFFSIHKKHMPRMSFVDVVLLCRR